MTRCWWQQSPSLPGSKAAATSEFPLELQVEVLAAAEAMQVSSEESTVCLTHCAFRLAQPVLDP